MFDLIAGGTRHPFHDSSMAPAVVSAAVHSLVIGTVIIVPLMLATNTLPPVPTMMAFVAAAPPPPPPPPPPPKRAEAPPVRPVATAGSDAAPITAPSAVEPEPPSRYEEDEGVEGGVEGGLIGGVSGGIVGGLIEAPPPPPPPPPPKGPVRIGGNITSPALVHRVEPRYPNIAVVAKVSGVVILEATVGTDGAVKDIQLLRSVKLLDQAAIDAVKQWRYSPLILNGVPTPFILTVTLSFRIPS